MAVGIAVPLAAGSWVYPGPGYTRDPYGKGSDTGPPQVGAGSLSFCRFSMFLVVFLGLPAGCPTLPALFEGLCSCGVFLSTETSLHRAFMKVQRIPLDPRIRTSCSMAPSAREPRN